ncbi:hypothetical protein E3N88_10481 [Mikania micrantha]|uniref:Allene oxide synthase n=1 Tax=Mikania micrantha TaxID=192012 RepID=A0A5N6PAS1_9ASTR|nr:hypothetical protein E3N88_10481 [Mikania micrantha]
MASSSLSFSSLHHLNLETPKTFRRRRPTTVLPIIASKDSLPPLSATSADIAPIVTGNSSPNLPLRMIPGSYGIPFIQPLKDRFEYFYAAGGRDEYFKSRVNKYQSTVFRANMPPGPFIAGNPRVVVLLDAKSFPTLFDVSKVEKKDLFTGTFMPSTELTGGHRVLSYLDPSEPKHAPLKNLVFFMLKSSRNRILPEFEATYDELFNDLELELAQKGKAFFNDAGEQAAFRFLGRAYLSSNPEETMIGKDGPKLISTWVLFNLGPLLRLGLPWFVEEPLLHTFRLPPALIKKNYQKLYDYFESSSSPIIEEAQSLGISKEEAIHNILFTVCFNTFGGIKILFPNTLKWLGRAGTSLHTQLSSEIRNAIKTHGVKEGEMLFGYQPFATKDPKVFDRPEEFVPDRFVGDGENLLKYVMWSNGPETEAPTTANKQCAGKDFVVLITRLFVVELFRRYDSFDIEVAASPLGAKVTLTSLKRARV